MTMEIPENSGINKHAIELIKANQPTDKLIYSLNSMKLETLKIYIKAQLKTRFIRHFKFLATISILFDKKLNGSLWLCINY